MTNKSETETLAKGPTIPPELVSRLRVYLNEKHTGTVTLHVKDGKILTFQVEECWRVAGDIDKQYT